MKYLFLLAYGLFLTSPAWLRALQRLRLKRLLRHPGRIARAWVTAPDSYWDACDLFVSVGGKPVHVAAFEDVRPAAEALARCKVAIENIAAIGLAEQLQASEAETGGHGFWLEASISMLSLLLLWALFFIYAWHVLLGR